MGVMTSSQFLGKKADIGRVEGNKPSHVVRPNADSIGAYKFAPASMGESKAFVSDGEGHTWQLPLVDKIFIVPEDANKAKKEKYRKVLLADGWEDVSINNAKSEPKIDKKFFYFAGHPDNTDIDKINGNVAVKFKRKEHQLECIEGVVIVEDKGLYKALLKKGFYEAKDPEEIKDSED